MRTDRRTNNDRFLARQFRCCSPKISKAIFPRERQLLMQSVRRGPSVHARSFAPILSGPLRLTQTGARGPSFLEGIGCQGFDRLTSPRPRSTSASKPSRDHEGAVRHLSGALLPPVARAELRPARPNRAPSAREWVRCSTCPIHPQVKRRRVGTLTDTRVQLLAANRGSPPAKSPKPSHFVSFRLTRPSQGPQEKAGKHGQARDRCGRRSR